MAVSARKTELLKQLSLVKDTATLDRLVPLLDQELSVNTLDIPVLAEVLTGLYTTTDDPGLCALVKRLQNRLRTKKMLGRDLLRQVSAPMTQNEQDALWEELNELKKSWQQATGKPDFDAIYEVLKEIGNGGMSVVFLARRRSDEKKVAVKFLRRRFFTSTTVTERFRRECRVSLSLDHPRIIRVFEAGEHDGGGFLVMEYLPLGGAHRLLDDPGFSIDIAFQVAIQAAEALQVIHEKDIVHRDLKLANLLIADYQPENSSVTIKLTDFGICRDKTNKQLTETDSTLGTELYMAPEQLQSAAGVDFRADLYSLGVLIYRIFSRKYFPVGEYTPLHKLNPALPQTLDNLVTQCLRHDPAKRPASAVEIRDNLVIILADLHQKPTHITNNSNSKQSP